MDGAFVRVEADEPVSDRLARLLDADCGVGSSLRGSRDRRRSRTSGPMVTSNAPSLCFAGRRQAIEDPPEVFTHRHWVRHRAVECALGEPADFAVGVVVTQNGIQLVERGRSRPPRRLGSYPVVCVDQDLERAAHFLADEFEGFLVLHPFAASAWLVASSADRTQPANVYDSNARVAPTFIGSILRAGQSHVSLRLHFLPLPVLRGRAGVGARSRATAIRPPPYPPPEYRERGKRAHAIALSWSPSPVARPSSVRNSTSRPVRLPSSCRPRYKTRMPPATNGRRCWSTRSARTRSCRRSCCCLRCSCSTRWAGAST